KHSRIANGSARGRFDRGAERAAREERAIQQRIDKTDAESGKAGKKTGAMQAGARVYPAPPLHGQHLQKPGHESELDLKPMYDAPYYKGSEKLLDKVALITGGDSGIGRAVAILFAREGADVAITYLPEEKSDANESKQAIEAEGRNALMIEGDVREAKVCKKIVERAVKEFGQLDILVNNAAYQRHQKKLEDLTVAQWDRTFKTNIYG